MTKSKLIKKLAGQLTNINKKLIKDAVKKIIEYMVITLASGRRIEIRGFGSFSLHYRAPRIGRNPKNGHKIELERKFVPYFKPGKYLRIVRCN